MPVKPHRPRSPRHRWTSRGYTCRPSFRYARAQASRRLFRHVLKTFSFRLTGLDTSPGCSYPWGMEVHFAPDTEAQLKQFAASKGKDAAQVVEETVARMLERQAQFIEGVNQGIAAADRGDLIDHDEVVNRIDRLFHS
jgi:predicted transcriptional regulator